MMHEKKLTPSDMPIGIMMNNDSGNSLNNIECDTIHEENVGIVGEIVDSAISFETKEKSKDFRPRGYRCAWENDPLLKDWVLRMPDDRSRIICRYCNCIIRGHKNFLLKHMATIKHLKNEEAFEMGQINAKTLVIPLRMDAEQVKKKKICGSDGSCILIESEQALFSDDDDGQGGDNFILPHVNPRFTSYTPEYRRKYKDVNVGNLTAKIGHYLMSDIKDMLKPHQPLSFLLRETQNLNSEKLKEMSRICVAELNNKYLSESVWESNTHLLPEDQSNCIIKQEMDGFQQIFESTLTELQDLKQNIKP